MSKKRTSPESSNDEQTKEGLDSIFQQDNNAKRARLSSLSDTTLQDQPIELLESILVKAVAMETKGTKLARSVWKEKADLVISRLRAVCSQWSSILTASFFRSELQKTLDASGTVRMEILHQSPLVVSPRSFFFPQLIALKDEIFVLCKSGVPDSAAFYVYDRSSMAKVKDFIPLPGINPTSLASCSVSNCLYIVNNGNCYHISILRITKEDEHKFTVSPVISDMWMPNHTLSVTANGSLILSSQQMSKQLTIISVYDANGSLQHKVRLTSDLILGFFKTIPKSNRNLVLVSCNGEMKIKLTEVDMDGTILRQYHSALVAFMGTCEADMYGRILIAERLDRMELLDSELNLLNFTGPQLDEDQIIYCDRMHYSIERNEVVSIVTDKNSQNERVLTIFRFTEE